MKNAISRFAREECGATSIEYALIAVVVSVSIFGVLTQIAGSLSAGFGKVSAASAHAVE